MNSDERKTGHGPDDMGDDEQEFELAEYKQYIEDPPRDLVIREDNDDDGEDAQDWADTHPRQVVGDDDDESDDDGPNRRPCTKFPIGDPRHCARCPYWLVMKASAPVPRGQWRHA